MPFLSGNNQVDVVEAFNSTSRYIDDLLNIDNRANPSDTEAPFLTLDFQLIRFARASSHVADFNTPNKLLTQKLLNHKYWYHKLCKTFSKFYRRYYDLIS